MSLQSFSGAVREPAGPVPPGVQVRFGADLPARIDVYRNNHYASLVAALSEGFPVCRALVGEAFFDALARCFVQAQPPDSPVLTEYGRSFPPFIETFTPARTVPYLADMARLEQLRTEAWHAADAEPIARADLEAALGQPEALPTLILRLHPSLGVLRSAHAVVDLWAAHQGEHGIESVDPSRPQCALVLRPRDVVRVLAVSPSTLALAEALGRGLALGPAMTSAMEACPHLDLAVALTELIRAEAFAVAPSPDCAFLR